MSLTFLLPEATKSKGLIMLSEQDILSSESLLEEPEVEKLEGRGIHVVVHALSRLYC